MHGQLRKADVHARDGDLRRGDGAERRAAGKVRAVGVDLHGGLRLAADGREQGAGHAVGRIALVGVELDDHAAVHPRRIGHVGVFRVVRVDGVGVVRRDEEALREQAQIPFLPEPQRERDAPQRVAQQARGRALLRLAADLLIVKRAEDRHAAGRRCRKEALQQPEHAAKVIQPRREHKFVLRTKDRPARADIQAQILAEDLVLLHARSRSHDAAEAAGSFLHAVERKRIDVRHELEAVVRGAVHVDGDGGDDEQITVDVDQLRLQLPVLRRDHAAGDGQRPVKPGTHEHAAVFFRRQLNIGPGLLFRVVLDLEGGRVGMRRGHQKARGRARRHAEREQGRAVARDKILSARRERPRVRLVQLRIALLRQPVGQRLHGVVAAGAGGQKIKKPFGIHEKTSMRRFLGFFQYSAPAGCPQGRKFAGCLFNADNLW